MTAGSAAARLRPVFSEHLAATALSWIDMLQYLCLEFACGGDGLRSYMTWLGAARADGRIYLTHAIRLG
jgi:hypothetical protein